MRSITTVSSRTVQDPIRPVRQSPDSQIQFEPFLAGEGMLAKELEQPAKAFEIRRRRNRTVFRRAPLLDLFEILTSFRAEAELRHAGSESRR